MVLVGVLVDESLFERAYSNGHGYLHVRWMSISRRWDGWDGMGMLIESFF
jgi:hypothetical protein